MRWFAPAARPVPVYVGESEAWRGVLTINPMALQSGQGAEIATALIEVVRSLVA